MKLLLLMLLSLGLFAQEHQVRATFAPLGLPCDASIDGPSYPCLPEKYQGVLVYIDGYRESTTHLVVTLVYLDKDGEKKTSTQYVKTQGSLTVVGFRVGRVKDARLGPGVVPLALEVDQVLSIASSVVSATQ